MSYCRFNWDGSDVYVIEADEGFVCYCERRFVCATPEEMIAHLCQHRRDGDFVPAYAIDALWCDIPGASAPVDRGPEVAMARECLRQTKVLLEEFGKFCSECGRKNA